MTHVSDPSRTAHPSIQSRFLEADGYRSHYLESGSPELPTAVLIHGGALSMTGWGADRWRPVMEPLAQSFRVLAIDEVGFGESDPPRDPHKLGNATTRAEHVRAFIEALGEGPVHLIAQSSGSWIAAFVALTAPRLVDRLVLVDSATASGSSRGRLPYMERMFVPGTMIPTGDFTSREGLRESQRQYVYDVTSITDEMIDRMIELSPRWYPRYRDEMEYRWGAQRREEWGDGPLNRPDYDQYLINGQMVLDLANQITARTLVIWGRESIKPLEAGVEFYKRLPNAEMHIYDKASHFVWLDHPESFVHLVRSFLTS